ncbi:MAG TPA: hypothetical protein PKN54_07655, partial [Candidatus Cloacimonas acidaminovorans]|nr:hypothetical protein [Candidatus Cloacimonas acidaminovorans]
LLHSVHKIILMGIELIVSLFVLLLFAFEDFVKQTINSEQYKLVLLLSIIFVLCFGNIFESLFVFILVYLFFELLRYLKITFFGDTLVISLIGFIYPNIFLILFASVIGFIIVSLVKKEKEAFIPYFFIGYLFSLLFFF